MGTITGSSVAEIDARIERVWEVVQDVLTAPAWQRGLKDMREVERDAEGHVTLAESSSDAKVRTIKSTVRFAYDGPTRMDWRQEKGELKSLRRTQTGAPRSARVVQTPPSAPEAERAARTQRLMAALNRAESGE